MNVVVIEDERLTADRLITMLKKFDANIYVLATISSVTEAISWLKDHHVDLIFMDIHLEDGDSFQIVSKLNLKTPIIFTTAFDEYMIKAFKVNSVDYLLKPVNYEELVAALDKFRSLRSGPDLRSLMSQLNPQFKERFMITVGTKIRSVKTTDVAYFYLQDKTVLLVTTDNTTLPIDYSLDKLMQMVDPKMFFRVSRQFIVSLNSVELVHAMAAGKLRIDLAPRSKQEVTVSGDRVSDFKQWLGKD